jgi:hypothetical protein
MEELTRMEQDEGEQNTDEEDGVANVGLVEG